MVSPGLAMTAASRLVFLPSLFVVLVLAFAGCLFSFKSSLSGLDRGFDFRFCLLHPYLDAINPHPCVDHTSTWTILRLSGALGVGLVVLALRGTVDNPSSRETAQRAMKHDEAWR